MASARDQELNLYRNELRTIKLKRFFEIKDFCDKHNLWDAVKAELPNWDSDDFRIHMDTLLLNAVKLAIFKKGKETAYRAAADVLTSSAAIQCAEKIDKADKADREREDQRRREACKAQGTC